MKRIICFLLSLVALFASFSVPCPTFAQDNPQVVIPSQAEISPQPQVTSTQSSMKHSDYALAYPGLLPDNPLYFLKAWRDAIMNFLITDTAKKSQFALIQSDKETNAGIMLINNNKESLAKSSFQRGSTYMDEAIENYQKAKSENKPVTSLRATIEDSLVKKVELVTDLSTKANDKEFFTSLLKTIVHQQASI